MTKHRRTFLKTAGGLATALVGTPVLAQAPRVSADSSRLPKPYPIPSQHRFALELEGVPAGFPQGLAGGDTYSDVEVSNVHTGGGFPEKHLTGVLKYEEIIFTADTRMRPAFYSWVQESIKLHGKPRNGALLDLDLRGAVIGRREFRNASLVEVAFPRLDAASKDAAYITVKAAPELVRTAPPRGSGGTATPKPWASNQFRLGIDRLDARSILTVEPIVFRQSAPTPWRERPGPPGPERAPEVSNLVFTVPEPGSRTISDWFDRFVIQGQHEERNGTLEFLSVDSQTALFTLTLTNLGIFSLRREEDPLHGALLRAEVYVERIDFSYDRRIFT